MKGAHSPISCELVRVQREHLLDTIRTESHPELMEVDHRILDMKVMVEQFLTQLKAPRP